MMRELATETQAENPQYKNSFSEHSGIGWRTGNAPDLYSEGGRSNLGLVTGYPAVVSWYSVFLSLFLGEIRIVC